MHWCPRSVVFRTSNCHLQYIQTIATIDVRYYKKGGNDVPSNLSNMAPHEMFPKFPKPNNGKGLLIVFKLEKQYSRKPQSGKGFDFHMNQPE